MQSHSRFQTAVVRCAPPEPVFAFSRTFATFAAPAGGSSARARARLRARWDTDFRAIADGEKRARMAGVTFVTFGLRETMARAP